MKSPADYAYSWENVKPGWHEVILHFPDYVTVEKHDEIIEWLSTNIGKFERHCRWYCEDETFKVKFRYERDYIWFKLTWG